MTTATSVCPRCHNAIAPGAKFCANCGSDISGVWSGSNPNLMGTIAVEADPNVDTLGSLLSEATLGDYDIYGELGRGGMAAVYLGLDLALNRKVAIKTMLPELVSREGMVQRFKREAQTAAGLNHPHIIQIYTVKQSKSLVYFVMKFIEGRSLESVIVDKGQVPLPMAQTILSQVGSALDHAHKKGVVHRDVKPANIMIDEDGWAIVTDFGIAKVQEAGNLTATGTAIGTPHYMSPEQFHNKAVTGMSDQYSLGVVVYEMLSGKKPFDGGTYAEIITQHLFEPVPDIRGIRPELPPEVSETINRMMAKDPAQRFPDIESAIHALGTPASKKEGDVVRTQMISLAKSGPQKKVRMSVPMSPIPTSKKAPSPAATMAEARPKGAPRPVPQVKEEKEEKGGRGWLWAAVLVIVLLGGGFFAVKSGILAGIIGGAASPASVTQASSSQPASPGAQTAPTAAEPAVDTVTQVAQAAAVDSTAIRDSIARARRADSLRIARAESSRIAAALERQRSKPPVEPVAKKPITPPVVAPVVPQTGQIRIASGTPGAVLYINSEVEGLLSSPRLVTIPAGVQVRLSIKASGCTPWDSTVIVVPGATTTIGRKYAKC